MTNDISDSKKTGFQLFTRFAFWIVSRAALIIVYFGIFMPVGFIMRLFNKDPLYRKLDAAAHTYYRPSRERVVGHMDKPY